MTHRLLTAMPMCPEEILPDDIAGDDAMLDLVTSLRYIRVNYVHFSSEEQCMYETLSWNLKILIQKNTSEVVVIISYLGIISHEADIKPETMMIIIVDRHASSISQFNIDSSNHETRLPW